MADVKIRILGENQAKGALSEVDQQLGGMKNALSSVTDAVMKTTAAVVGIGAAMDKAFEIGKQGAAVLQTEESFNRLIASTGAAADTLEKLRNASQGTVDDMTLMSSTLTLAAGAEDKFAQELINATPQLLEMAKAANKLNPTLGDTAYMYESIALGIKRGSPMILDNLGITVKMEEAYTKYADALGKAADELTSTEQKQAILNEVLDKGNILIEQAGGAAGSAVDPFNRLDASMKNIGDSIKAQLVPMLAEAAGALELILTRTEKINSAMQEHRSEMLDSARSYQEYRDELIRAAEVAGKLVDEEGNLYMIRKDGGRVMKEIIQTQYVLDEAAFNALRTAHQSQATYEGVAGAMSSMNVSAEEAAASQAALTEVLSAGISGAEKSTKSIRDIEAAFSESRDKGAVRAMSAEMKAMAEEAYRLAGVQDVLAGAMQGALQKATAAYTETVAGLVQENAKLIEMYNLMSSGAIPATSAELAELNTQIAANVAAQEKSQEALRQATAEMIFQKAAQGLNADAALWLARQMDLVSESDYQVLSSIQQLQNQFDANRDGMIDAAEGADTYAASIARIYDQVVRLQSVMPTATATSTTGYQEGIYTFGGPNGGSVSVPQSVSVNVSYQPLGAGDAYELQQALTPIVQGIVSGTP